MKDLIEQLGGVVLRLGASGRTTEMCLVREAAAALSSQAARIEELEALLRIEREHRSGPAF